MPVVSVVIPAFNAAATIGRTLDALGAQDVQEAFEVIVVDDGSDDGTVAIVEASETPARIVRQDHGGPGPARNRGAEAARSSSLAFTDADCFPRPGWLSAGLAALADADFVQGAVVPERTERPMPFDHSIHVTAETGLYESANLFLSRELFERLGGFEDWLGPVIGKPLAEDVWLGWRARRAGARMSFSSDAVVEHAVIGRSLREHVAARLRLTYFPRIAAKIPELRERFFLRVFLTRRTAAFDLAVLGTCVALALWSVYPLALAVPYLAMLAAGVAGWRRLAPLAAAGAAMGDAAGFLGLAWGSLRARTLLI